MEFGSGSQFIYVYYFPSQAANKYQWPCKIGKTRSNPVKRIKHQHASMQEEPVIGLMIRTNNCDRDEVILHTVLREHKLSTFGDEWFKINPNVVLNAYQYSAEDMTVGMQIRMARYDQNMTQTDLATAAGLRQATISKIENDGDVQLHTICECLRELKMRIILVDIPE